MNSNILQEQIRYYRDRAPEYDEWFFRQGRYDRGAAHREQWFAEISEVESGLLSIDRLVRAINLDSALMPS
jgi:demethylmenaquinone methyltransferase/2-methoxy-6-polyprenyl-1,4-benzoquinol methylase